MEGLETDKSTSLTERTSMAGPSHIMLCASLTAPRRIAKNLVGPYSPFISFPLPFTTFTSRKKQNTRAEHKTLIITRAEKNNPSTVLYHPLLPPFLSPPPKRRTITCIYLRSVRMLASKGALAPFSSNTACTSKMVFSPPLTSVRGIRTLLCKRSYARPAPPTATLRRKKEEHRFLLEITPVG